MLKLGEHFAARCAKQAIKVVLLANVHAVKHHSDYLSGLEDMIWTHEQRLADTDDLKGLPPKACEVVRWMASDEVRQVKAAASASYFVDLAQSLREIRRVLREGGRCAMVIARQHTFYRYKSREVVRMIANADVVPELAIVNGLEVEDAIHVELNKQNTVARPRSLDAYYETVLILRR